jgi:hypothetical protein
MMAFSRIIDPGPPPDSSELTAKMAGIGMNFAAKPRTDANIENTLVHAAEVGMAGGDLRVLAIVTVWMGVHHLYVNADRLTQAVAEHNSNDRVAAYWASVARWLASDRRFARLARGYEGPPVDLLAVGTDFQIARRGEDGRFLGTPLRVPAGTLRDRAADVLSPESLINRHAGYRNRVLFGPSWRADVWTVLERDPDLTIAEAARRAYCSFATAWQVSRDFKLLRGASAKGEPNSPN